jgi:hypothetical protein
MTLTHGSQPPARAVAARPQVRARRVARPAPAAIGWMIAATASILLWLGVVKLVLVLFGL